MFSGVKLKISTSQLARKIVINKQLLMRRNGQDCQRVNTSNILVVQNPFKSICKVHCASSCCAALAKKRYGEKKNL